MTFGAETRQRLLVGAVAQRARPADPPRPRRPARLVARRLRPRASAGRSPRGPTGTRASSTSPRSSRPLTRPVLLHRSYAVVVAVVLACAGLPPARRCGCWWCSSARPADRPPLLKPLVDRAAPAVRPHDAARRRVPVRPLQRRGRAGPGSRSCSPRCSCGAATSAGWSRSSRVLSRSLIGLDRLLLGVHDVTDVVAGCALGALWVAGLAYVFDPTPRPAEVEPLPSADPEHPRARRHRQPDQGRGRRGVPRASSRPAPTELGWGAPIWYETTIEDPGRSMAHDAAVGGAELVRRLRR